MRNFRKLNVAYSRRTNSVQRSALVQRSENCRRKKVNLSSADAETSNEHEMQKAFDICHLAAFVFIFRLHTRDYVVKIVRFYAALNLYVEYSMENRDGAARSDLVRFRCVRSWFARMPDSNGFHRKSDRSIVRKRRNVSVIRFFSIDRFISRLQLRDCPLITPSPRK